MSSYVVLARRWRPRNFDALIGQQHVVQALKNGLASGRVPHAFLFSGTRGVGKTTLARILAMRLNCQSTTTPEPCGRCDSCQEVISGSHPDVMEIDAASRTKVEQMRELLELAPYAPAASPFKVFILDEIHMLSTQSFNALLKTLEEPPTHVKFIFATTEPRKIPATILSRCQRHDLKRVTGPVLTKHLEAILTKEEITWDALGLQAVVQAASGSVRDGLSLLDQAISHGNGTVLYDAVRTLLGLTDQDAVVRLLDHILTGQGQEVLHDTEQFYVGGVEPAALVRDLLGLVHQRTRQRVTTPKGQDGPSLEHLQMVYQALLKGEMEVKQADQPAQAVEMVLLRVTYLQPIPELDKLIAALSGGSGSLPPIAPKSGERSVVVSGNVSVMQEPVPVAPVVARVKSIEGSVSMPAVSVAKGSKSLTSWEELLSFAHEHAGEVARILRGHVACLEFGRDGEGQLNLLHLKMANDCFGTPDHVKAMVKEFFVEQGLARIRVVVDSASIGPRPETQLEESWRLEQQHRLRLEQELLAHPDVQRLMAGFDAKLFSVEPLARMSGPNVLQ